jgi:hypothetical protein
LKTWNNLEVGVLLIGQRLLGSNLHLAPVLFHELGIDGNLRRRKGRSGNEVLFPSQYL